MMGKIYAILLSLAFVSFFSNAQTTLYSNNFTGGSSGWQLGQGGNFDTWVVNNVYSCTDPTPDQGGGNYMHVYDDLNGEYCAAGVFLGFGSGGTVYATMTSGINTVGQNAVSITFDWLCKGQQNILKSFGFVDYSINGGSNWTNITQPKAEYNGQATWTTATITSAMVPDLLNQSNLRLRFGFTNSGYGTNPAFAVDNILVTGDVPTALSPSLSQQGAGIRTSPNPAHDELYIYNNSSGKCTLTISNLLGRKMLSVIRDGNSRESLDIKSLPAGIYILSIQAEEGNCIRKFVKE